MGGILDGMPSLVKIDREEIQRELDRRAPGRRADTSQRKEPDRIEILSGLSEEGLTLGSPIGFIVRNQDARSQDYGGYTNRFRPNHADFTYYAKYGIHAFAGGGRASARATVSWVAGGAFCRQWLRELGVKVEANYIATNNVEEARNNGDSTGGLVEGLITGLPVGIGEPLFDKLHARLGMAMMSINGVKGFEYGDGFGAAEMLGSEAADFMVPGINGGVGFKSNHSGGILGGISNGMPINFRVAFKPTPTIMRPLETVDVNNEPTIINPAGRHDPCIAIRGAVVVEAMALLTIADMMRIAGYGSTYARMKDK